MTLKALIDFVDALKENTFSYDVKTVWVNEIEGQIQTEVHLMAVADVVQYVWPDNQEAELIVAPPYDKLYRYYLESMIAFEQEEMERYANSQEMFQKCFLEYVGFVASTMNPANGCAERAQYYLSAYGLAVKLGYKGTLEEWLESLKGEKGDPFRYEDFTQEQLEGLTEGIKDYATQEAIKAAQESVEQAAQDAADRVQEIVKQDATEAQEAAERAETAAKTAEGSKTAAAESEVKAAAGASSAAGSAQAATQSEKTAQTAKMQAEESARAATASAAKAEASEEAAGESAEAAEAAAKRAESVVGKTSYIGENGNWYEWDTTTNSYRDTGRPATALVDQNSGKVIRMWFGTVREYNLLPKIEDDVYYNILEGEP